MSDQISRLKQVGVALGVIYGATPASLTRGLMVKTFEANPSQDVAPVPEVHGSLGIVRVTKPPITYSPKLSFAVDVGDVLSASIGDFLASVYGTETGTKVSLDYKHKFTLKNTGQPCFLDIWSDKDQTHKVLLSNRVQSVKFSIDGKQGLINADVSMTAKDEAALVDQTLAFSDEPLLTPHMATVFKVGGASVTNFESVEITLSREQESLMFIGNSRVTGDVVSGKTFMFDIVLSGLNFADETERAKFKANGSTSFELKLVDPNTNYLHFVCPEIYYKTFDGPSISDTDLLRISLAAFVTGSDTAHYIELQNRYTKNYETGATIV